MPDVWQPASWKTARLQWPAAPPRPRPSSTPLQLSIQQQWSVGYYDSRVFPGRHGRDRTQRQLCSQKPHTACVQALLLITLMTQQQNMSGRHCEWFVQSGRDCNYFMGSCVVQGLWGGVPQLLHSYLQHAQEAPAGLILPGPSAAAFQPACMMRPPFNSMSQGASVPYLLLMRLYAVDIGDAIAFVLAHSNALISCPTTCTAN